MLLTTVNNYNENEYTPIGLVRGTIVHSVSFFRDILGNITGILGGKNTAINKKVDDVYEEAVKELEKYTKEKYPSADAIAGIEISLTEMREFFICVATGTALRRRSSGANIQSVRPGGGRKRRGTRLHKYKKNSTIKKK
jgi:uncharacterized protein YbjQ (UPF0145 family)